MASILNVDQINNAAGTSAITIDSGGNALMPGHVIGYKTVVAATSTSTSSSTYADITGMTLDYACKVANSLVYVLVHVHVFIPQQATAWQGAGIKILRASTALYTDVGYGVGHYTDSANNRFMHNVSVTAATEPGDTSSHTYKVQGAKLKGSGDCDFNNSGYGGGGRITVMEIAQ